MRPEFLHDDNQLRLLRTPVKLEEVNHLASNAFELNIDMGSRIQDWHLVISARRNNELCALGAYMFVNTNHGLILYEDIKVVLKSLHGQGVGSRITEEAIQSSLSRSPNGLYLLARTQNGQEFHSLKRGVTRTIKRYNLIAPLETRPSDVQIEVLSAFLGQHPPKRGDVDIETFIHRGAYRTYPNMTIGLGSKDDGSIETYLNRFGRSKQSGDAVYLLTLELKNIE